MARDYKLKLIDKSIKEGCWIIVLVALVLLVFAFTWKKPKNIEESDK